MSQKSYVWNRNSPLRYQDPSGYDPGLPLPDLSGAANSIGSAIDEVSDGLIDAGPAGQLLGEGLQDARFAVVALGDSIKTIARVSALRAATEAQAAGATRGAAAALTIGERTFTDLSGGAAGPIGRMATATHPIVQEALDAVSKTSPYHGDCGEIGCLSQALFAGENPAGGFSAAARIRQIGDPAHGELIGPCRSCKSVLTRLEVRY